MDEVSFTSLLDSYFQASLNFFSMSAINKSASREDRTLTTTSNGFKASITSFTFLFTLSEKLIPICTNANLLVFLRLRTFLPLAYKLDHLVLQSSITFNSFSLSQEVVSSFCIGDFRAKKARKKGSRNDFRSNPSH